MWEQATHVKVRAAAGSGTHRPQRRVEALKTLKKLRKKLQAAPSATTAQLERLAELEATEKELALVRPGLRDTVEVPQGSPRGAVTRVLSAALGHVSRHVLYPVCEPAGPRRCVNQPGAAGLPQQRLAG